MCMESLSHAVVGLAGEQAESDQQHGAHGDAAVGEVEHRIVPLAKIDVDEIGDLGCVQPVDQVAERAADDQRQRQAGAPVVAGRAL